MISTIATKTNHTMDWTHSSLESREIPGKGWGVVAISDIKAGELLIVFGGRVVTSEQLRVEYKGEDVAIQIEEGLFFVSTDDNHSQIADRLNHSCNPNAGFLDQISIVSIAQISAGTEVCIDYATCSATADVQPQFQCACGSVNCRGVVSSDDWRRNDLQLKLGEYFQPFLKRRISAFENSQENGTDLFSRSEVPSLCLRDVERTEAFKKAIGQIVRPGDVVLDAGSGSGILAMLAAAAGARKVFAVEANPALAKLLVENVKLNGFQETIEVVCSDVRTLVLSEKADVLIAEMIDTWLLDELQIPALNSLRKNGVIVAQTKIIPSRYSAFIEIGYVDFNCYGFRLPFPCHNWPDLIAANGWNPMSFNALTGKTMVFEVSFDSIVEPSFDLLVQVNAMSAGIANAVRLSGIAQLDESTSLGETVAFNGDKILPIEEVTVSAGQAISFRVKGSRGGTVGLVQCSIVLDEDSQANQ